MSHMLRLSDPVESCGVDTLRMILPLGDLSLQQVSTDSVILHHTLDLHLPDTRDNRRELGHPPNQPVQLNGMHTSL